MRKAVWLVALGWAVASTPGAVAQEYKGDMTQIGVTPTLHLNLGTGVGATVGVLDGLADRTHDEFNGRLTTATYSNGTYTQYDLHGTHVSGTIAAGQNGFGMVGVAPGASIVNVGVFDDRGWVADPSAALALAYVVGQGATIVSMSYGPTLSGDVFLNGELNTFAQYGNQLVIARAAGNDGRNARNEFFAGDASSQLSHILIVGSVDANNRISSFSTRPGSACIGPSTRCSADDQMRNFFLVAPGRSVYSTAPGDLYATMSGTSMATPHVAGAAALLQGAWPHLKLDPKGTASILKLSATDLGTKGVDSTYGWGLLNVPRAFQPLGTTFVATGTTVTDGGTPTSSNRLRLRQSAVPGAMSVQAALSDLVVFDDFGRDFAADVSVADDGYTGPDMLERLSALRGMLDEPGTMMVLGSRTLSFTSETGYDGSVLSEMSMTRPGFGLTFGYGAALGFAASDGVPAVDDADGLLRREMALGLGPAGDSLANATFVGGETALAEGLSLAAFYADTSLRVRDASVDSMPWLVEEEKPDTSLMGLRLGYEVSNGVVLGASYQRMTESDQLLGGETRGAFALAENATTEMVGTSLAVALDRDLSVFAFYQEAWTRAETGAASLFGDVDGWRARRSGVALEWRNAVDANDRLELAAVRPLSVYSGSGTASVPVGRTVDGDVVYADNSYSVDSSAQPLELTLTYLGPKTEWAPGREYAYGLSLGYWNDDVAGAAANDGASVLFTLKAGF